MHDTTHYTICRALDERTNIMGLPLDEFIPLVVIFMIGLVTHMLIYSLFIMIACFALFRRLKRRGAWVLWVFIYRHTTRELARLLMPGSPSPTIRYWW